VVAGVDSSRKKVSGRAVESLPAGAVIGSFAERNLIDPMAVGDITRDVLRRAGARGHEISVVIPDDSSRITFLTVETLPGKTEDREALIRWKLKKTVPFDVDSAQLAYQVLGAHEGSGEKGIDLVVALSPRSVVQEYEELLERLDIHGGYVTPSIVSALNLHPRPSPVSRPEDSLFVKIAPDSIATVVFQNNRPKFYRRVGDMPLYDAVYPTMMYYQDKLGGKSLTSATLCRYDSELRSEILELQDRLGVQVRATEPKNVEDIFKPALGAAGLVWANSI
jgi:type IV pilus assembly protein PilM